MIAYVYTYKVVRAPRIIELLRNARAVDSSLDEPFFSR